MRGWTRCWRTAKHDLPAAGAKTHGKPAEHSPGPVARREYEAKEAEQRKNDLVVYLAHDLKTPLTSVIGYLSLLNEEKEISPVLRDKYTNIALDKAVRLEGLIDEFFEITRFNLQGIELERSRINLTRLLCQLADEFYPVFSEERLTCKLHIPQGLEVWAMRTSWPAYSTIFSAMLSTTAQRGQADRGCARDGPRWSPFPQHRCTDTTATIGADL